MASADSENIEKNSQSMDLLEANMSSISFFSKKDNKEDEIDLNKDVKIVAENTLVPSSSLVSAKGGDVLDSSDPAADQISVYVVRKGDSIAQIAQMFNVSVNTILWANDLKKGEKLVEGDTLIILPVSGVSHTVLKGQTLKGIATLYKVDTSDIAAFNGISEKEKLTVGSDLIIPDGILHDGGTINTKKPDNTNQSVKKYTYKDLPAITGYYMNPVPGARLSQGFHNGNGSIDLAIAKGTPILASASGTVIFAKLGWNGAYGGLVIIKHANGTQTLYAHLSKLGTSAGSIVSQGEVIGYVGSTGRSTGPHVHFEIRGAKSPAAFYPVGVHLDANWKY